MKAPPLFSPDLEFRVLNALDRYGYCMFSRDEMERLWATSKLRSRSRLALLEDFAALLRGRGGGGQQFAVCALHFTEERTRADPPPVQSGLKSGSRSGEPQMQYVERFAVVDAPVAASYRLWQAVDEWPRFLKAIREVRRIDEKCFTLI